MAGQALNDLAGFGDAIGAWRVGNCDGRAGVGQHATGGSADGTRSTDDQRDIAIERFGIRHRLTSFDRGGRQHGGAGLHDERVCKGEPGAFDVWSRRGARARAVVTD